MSNSPDDKDVWSQHSASLFREARRAHDPTPLERARLDAILARIQAGDPEALLAAKYASDAAARNSGALLRQISKVSLAVVCVAAVAIPFIRWSRQPSEPVRDAQLASSAHASSPTPAAIPSNATPSALPQMSEARDERDSPPRNQRRRARTNPDAPRTSQLNLIALPEASRPAPNATSAPPNASPAIASPATAARQSSLRATSAAQNHAQEATVAAAVRAQETVVAPVERVQEAVVAPAEREAERPVPQAPPTELALLKRMHAALRKADYATVMTLCAEHERRWPHGVFEFEREGVRAIAACEADADGAIPQAKRFLAAHPHAPIAMRVSSACIARLPK